MLVVFVPAGLVAELPVGATVLVAVCVAAEPPPGIAGLFVVAPVVPFAVAPEFDAGVAAGVEAGKEVKGVGSGGNGFARMLATISVIPASDWCRYLYQELKLSLHWGF